MVLCKASRRVSIVFTSRCSFIFHYLQFVIIFDTTLSRHLLGLRLHVTLKFYLFRFLVVLFVTVNMSVRRNLVGEFCENEINANYLYRGNSFCLSLFLSGSDLLSLLLGGVGCYCCT